MPNYRGSETVIHDHLIVETFLLDERLIVAFT